MKMSEAYDRTKKLERMISDLQHSIKSLEHRAIPADNSYDHSIAITTLEAKRQELIDAVTELGNMDVVTPPTPGAVATPEDNAAQNIAAKVYDLQHAVSPTAPSEKYGWTGKQLVGELCLFSNNRACWQSSGECVGYNENSPTPYAADIGGDRQVFYAFAKWHYNKSVEEPA